MKFTVDIERRFSDIKTYDVEASDIAEAHHLALQQARKDNWNWPSDPSFSLLFSSQQKESN